MVVCKGGGQRGDDSSFPDCGQLLLALGRPFYSIFDLKLLANKKYQYGMLLAWFSSFR